MCISHNIASSFHCHMCRLEFKVPLPPVKKTKDPGLHKGNAGPQTLDSGLLPKGFDSYATQRFLSENWSIKNILRAYIQNFILQTTYIYISLKQHLCFTTHRFLSENKSIENILRAYILCKQHKYISLKQHLRFTAYRFLLENKSIKNILTVYKLCKRHKYVSLKQHLCCCFLHTDYCWKIEA